MRLRRLEPVLRRALRGPCRLREGSRLLVAVSGGADSSALLVALTSLAREFAIELRAAHLHHGLRGVEADADADHVRALCARLGVSLVIGRRRPATRASEATLRAARRRFLVAAAKRLRCSGIATAHTADDQLETLLMRLARGTGLVGLAGMRPRHGAWLKPLLEATRADVERDLARAKLTWRTDTSNATRAYFRNRVRLDVVPALARAAAPEVAPAVAREALARHAVAAALEVAEAGASVRARAARALATAGVPRRADHLDLVRLAAQPDPAVRRAALRRWWSRACPDSTGLPRPVIESLLSRLAAPDRDAVLRLEGGRIARIRNGVLALEPRPAATSRRRAASKGRRASKARPGDVMVRRRSPSRPTTRSSPPSARTRAAERA